MAWFLQYCDYKREAKKTSKDGRYLLYYLNLLSVVRKLQVVTIKNTLNEIWLEDMVISSKSLKIVQIFYLPLLALLLVMYVGIM